MFPLPDHRDGVTRRYKLHLPETAEPAEIPGLGNGGITMGRHSLSYHVAQQALSVQTPSARRTSVHVGRVGLLAVTLGIEAAAAGGTAIANADTSPSNDDGDRAASSSSQSPGGAENASASAAAKSRGPSARNDAADDVSDDTERRARRDDDPGSVPATSLKGVKDSTVRGRHVDPEAAAGVEDPTVDLAPESMVLDVPQPAGRDIDDTSASTVATVEAPVPSPADQAPTEYGDIGKWMLGPNGQIADYGGAPHQGKTVLETVNVIIVDPTSRNSLEATWRLSAAMRRSGFPPRLIHSTGFRGLIDDQRYRQQPRGLFVGYSDAFFLVPNNHGRIFGPAPVETVSGYVWSGAFSTEEMAWVNGLPRHVYVSSNQARAALAARLVASGRARLGGMVALGNSYDTDTTTTGDHDGYAVVVILNDRGMFGAQTTAAAGGSDNRACVGAGYSSTPSATSCDISSITTIRGIR